MLKAAFAVRRALRGLALQTFDALPKVGDVVFVFVETPGKFSVAET